MKIVNDILGENGENGVDDEDDDDDDDEEDGSEGDEDDEEDDLDEEDDNEVGLSYLAQDKIDVSFLITQYNLINDQSF